MKFGNEPVAVTGDENGKKPLIIFKIGKAPSVGKSGSQKTCLENEPVIARMACVVQDLMDKKGFPGSTRFVDPFFLLKN